MELLPIANHLAAKGCGNVTTTIFVNEMPSGCDFGILLMDQYHGTEIDQYLPGYFDTEFRLIVRGASFEKTKALTKKASKVLKEMNGDIETLFVKQCLPLNLPRTYRRSTGGYWEFEADISIVFVDNSA